MNTLLTTALLNGNNPLENNGLKSIFQQGDALPGSSGFQEQFAGLWQQLAATDGKEQPFNLAALREINPELIQQISEQLDISQEALLALPPSALQALTQGLQHPHAFQQGSNLLPQLNAAALLQAKAGTEGKYHDLARFEGDSAAQALKYKEQLANHLFRLNADDNKQQPQSALNLSEFVDKDIQKQLAVLKLFNPELEHKLLASTFTQDVSHNRVFESMAALDKLNPNNAALAFGNISVPGRLEQAGMQLPRIAVPVNQPNWGQAVGERLMFMANAKVQAANLILNPPELGPIEVRLNMNHDQASIQFVSAHAAVRDAIEEAFPRLREMFAQNGLNLADANVSQQSAQQDKRSDHSSNGFVLSDTSQAETEETTAVEATTFYTSNSLVDQYV